MGCHESTDQSKRSIYQVGVDRSNSYFEEKINLEKSVQYTQIKTVQTQGTQPQIQRANIGSQIQTINSYTCQLCIQVSEQSIVLDCQHVYHDHCLVSLIMKQLELNKTKITCICDQHIKKNVFMLLNRQDLFEQLIVLQAQAIYKQYQKVLYLIHCKNKKCSYYQSQTFHKKCPSCFTKQ